MIIIEIFYEYLEFKYRILLNLKKLNFINSICIWYKNCLEITKASIEYTISKYSIIYREK